MAETIVFQADFTEANSGTSPATIVDSANSNNLAITYGSSAGYGSDSIGNFLDLNGSILQLSNNDAPVPASSIGNLMLGQTQLGVTVVADFSSGHNSGGRIFALGTIGGNGDVAGLLEDDIAKFAVRYDYESGGETLNTKYPDDSVDVAGPHVYYFRYNTNATGAQDQTTLFVDGIELSQQGNAGTATIGSTLANIANTNRTFSIGDRAGGGRNVNGKIYHLDISTGNLTDQEIIDKAAILSVDSNGYLSAPIDPQQVLTLNDAESGTESNTLTLSGSATVLPSPVNIYSSAVSGAQNDIIQLNISTTIPADDFDSRNERVYYFADSVLLGKAYRNRDTNEFIFNWQPIAGQTNITAEHWSDSSGTVKTVSGNTIATTIAAPRTIPALTATINAHPDQLTFFPKGTVSSELGFLAKFPAGTNNSAAGLSTFIFLNGAGTVFGQGGNLADELNVLTQEGIARQIAEGVEYPFIVITPQIGSSAHSFASYYQFIEDIKTWLGSMIDVEKVKAGGYSAGAMYTEEFAEYSINKTNTDQTPPQLAALMLNTTGTNATHEGDQARLDVLREIPIWWHQHARDGQVNSYAMRQNMKYMIGEVAAIGGNLGAYTQELLDNHLASMYTNLVETEDNNYSTSGMYEHVITTTYDNKDHDLTHEMFGAEEVTWLDLQTQGEAVAPPVAQTIILTNAESQTESAALSIAQHQIITLSDAEIETESTTLNVTQGIQTITANHAESSTESSTLTLVLNEYINQAPTVSVNALTEAETGDAVLITAAAFDDIEVSQVEFFIDGQGIGIDTTYTYMVNWTATLGTHQITATVTDNEGLTTTTANRQVVVTDAIIITPPTGDDDIKKYIKSVVIKPINNTVAKGFTNPLIYQITIDAKNPVTLSDFVSIRFQWGDIDFNTVDNPTDILVDSGLLYIWAGITTTNTTQLPVKISGDDYLLTMGEVIVPSIR